MDASRLANAGRRHEAPSRRSGSKFSIPFFSNMCCWSTRLGSVVDCSEVSPTSGPQVDKFPILVVHSLTKSGPSSCSVQFNALPCRNSYLADSGSDIRSTQLAVCSDLVSVPRLLLNVLVVELGRRGRPQRIWCLAEAHLPGAASGPEPLSRCEITAPSILTRTIALECGY